MRLPVLTAVCTAAALFASPVTAQAEAASRSVDISGIDLATPEGQRLLDRRVEAAARAVCEADRVQTGTRIPSSSIGECLETARNSAREQITAAIAKRNRGG